MHRRRGVRGTAGAWLWATALACGALSACGSPSVTLQQDGGPIQGTDQLTAPDGTEQGLAFGTAGVLRVLYLDADGNPRPGRTVEFTIVGDARGSTLSAPSGQTDATGLATVEVRAGQAETTFEVHAQGEAAGELVFVVSVNESGLFAMLLVRASVPTDLVVTGPLTVLLYDEETCASLPAFAPPATPRTKIASDPESEVSFGPLLGNHDYAVMIVPGGTGVPEVSGCVDLIHDRLIPGDTVLALVPLRRLLGTPAAGYRVQSRLLVGGLDGVADAFAPLACPLSPADLLVDCLLDARSTGPGDPLDCVPSSADLDSVGRALNSNRGTLGSDGCRAENSVPGVPSPSLEKVLHDQLATLLPTATQALAQATRPEVVAQALATLELGSDLRLAATPSPDEWVATHLLLSATFSPTQGSGAFTADLTAQGLPLGQASEIPVTLSASGLLMIDQHELSLRFGTLARQAAGALVFEPHGLPGDSAALVDLFTTALADGHPDACAALDELLCPAAGLTSGCLGASCADALAALPAAIDARILAFDGGADLVLQGSAQPVVTTGPVAESLSAGQWTVGLGPAGSRTSLAATFSGTPEPEARHQNQ